MNRLEDAHEVWRQNEGYAIPETCQVFQDNFDSGIVYYNCNKYKNNENYLQLFNSLFSLLMIIMKT